jgi:hypothetical protein
VESFWQFLDTRLLAHQLWLSILYLHSQPPLMNLYYGILIQLFPTHWPAATYGVNLSLGLLAYMAAYSIMVAHKVAVPVALGVVLIAMSNPSAAIFEAEPFYTHTVFCLVIFSAYLFDIYLMRPGIGLATAFLGVLATLALYRASYQLVWYVLSALWLIKISPRNLARRVLSLALLFGAMIGGLYLKNDILFGFFNSSSGSGMSLAKSWAGTSETKALVRAKELSPISGIPAPNSIDKYRSVLGPSPRTSVEAVASEFKDNGTMNLNNIGYVEVTRLYTRDYLRLAKLRPKTIARQMAIGWLDFFRPASAWIEWFDPGNQSAVEALDRPYTAVFCWGAKWPLNFALPLDGGNSPKRTLRLRLRSESWETVALYALFAVFLFFLPFQRWIAAEDGSGRQLLLFLIANIAYSAILCSSVEIGENMRYRYETQGLVLIAATIVGSRILRASFDRLFPPSGTPSGRGMSF